MKLSPTLKFLGRFQVPSSEKGFDTDFGASPVFFNQYVGACNKNGVFYALYQSTMKLAWQRQISGPAGDMAECIAAPVWNGKHLFFGTPAATIGNVSYVGSVQEHDPNGHLVWITGLPNGINGSPTMDGGGVLAVGTYDYNPTPNATYLIDAANGKILRDLVTGEDFAQSVFADDWLFSANQYGVYAWGIDKAWVRAKRSLRRRSRPRDHPSTETPEGSVPAKSSFRLMHEAAPVIPGPSSIPTWSCSMTKRHSLQTSCCSTSPPQSTWR